MNCKGKFFTYENYPNNYIRIHRGECTRCNCGQGVQNEILNGQNGQWSGPFNSYQVARNHAIVVARQMPRRNTKILNCKFCNPN